MRMVMLHRLRHVNHVQLAILIATTRTHQILLDYTSYYKSVRIVKVSKTKSKTIIDKPYFFSHTA